MKKPITTIFFVISTMLFGQAQTVDEIINKHIAAMGGKEKMMSLKTVKMTGTLTSPQGPAVSYTLIKKHLTGARLDNFANGAKSWFVTTPKKGWSSFSGQTVPKEYPEDALKFAQTHLDLQGPFLNYKEKGSKIELAGNEKINGAECYNLKVINKSGDVVNYHVDIKTYHIIKKTFKAFFTIYADYKQTVNGYWFAYTELTNNGGKKAINKIETNIPIDNKIFEVDEGVF